MADYTISGTAQSITVTLTGTVTSPITATVNGDPCSIFTVGRVPFVDGMSNVIELSWNTLNAGTYAYEILDNLSYVIDSGSIIISDPQPITEVKTINNQSIIGEGNLTVGGGTFSGTMDDISDGATYVKTENNLSDTLKNNYDGAVSNSHVQNTDTGTNSTTFLVNSTAVILEGDSRLDDDRFPTAHTHAQSEVTGLTDSLSGKQATLESGVNIKTVNSNSLLGSGNITIESGSGSSISSWDY